jgi:heterodisulfide reductase subunit A
MNPYLCEIANIREQCSWVHKDREKATEKAKKITASGVRKVILNSALVPLKVPVTKRAVVIGGGISGIQAALDIANSGYDVVLVERSPSIGGHMAQLSETFPTLDCSQCILTPRMVEAGQHPKIKLLTYSEVEGVDGYVGNFKVKVRRKAAYVDREKCTGCGLCIEKCPAKTPSDFEGLLGKRKAIYTPFPQAVPNKPVIDRESCIYFKNGRCRVCEKFCTVGAIDFNQADSFEEIEAGAIIVATGFELYDKKNLGEYGYGKYPDVIDGLQFERLLSASGPTAGVVKRPSDGKIPQEVVFIQCAGSRDTENGVPYCSKICCMYTAKHAKLYKHRVHSGNAHVFYIDIRSGGKGYEEFVQKIQEEDRVNYYRGKVSKLYQKKNGKIVVSGVDTLAGKKVEIEADLVVLATPVSPQADSKALSRKFKIGTDSYGFFSEAHPKLRPVESTSAGFFLAGCAQGPKDIPECVSQASAVAAKALVLFSSSELTHEPSIARVIEDRCSGCRICIATCPYGAREFDGDKKVAKVQGILCEGCGSCVAACPSGASTQENLTDDQILEMTNEVLR